MENHVSTISFLACVQQECIWAGSNCTQQNITVRIYVSKRQACFCIGRCVPKLTILYKQGGLFVNCPVFVQIRGLIFRGETRALIGGGGGEYSYLLVLPDEFLLKSAVIKVNFKRNSSGRTRIYEYSPPPPINALVSPLLILSLSGKHPVNLQRTIILVIMLI